MKQRSKWLIIFTALLMVFSLGTAVLADDDDDDDDDKYEYYQKDHVDDEYDEGWDRNQSNQPKIPVASQLEYWNIWSREPRNNPDLPLPVETPSEVILRVGNKESTIYMIPQDGQLLVSADAIANALGADSVFYPQSKICVLSTEDTELIVRAGSNAVYENKVKTPMPLQAAAYENSVYIPISVAANALGYRVSWDTKAQAITLQTF